MIKDSLLSVAARLIGVAAVFGMHVILTRTLAIGLVGDFVTGLSFVAVLGIVCRVGLDAVVTRRASIHLQNGDVATARHMLKSALCVCFGIACLFATALYLLSPIISQTFQSPGLTRILQILTFSIPAFGSVHLLAYMLFGMQKSAVGCLFQSAVIPAGAGTIFIAISAATRESAITYSIAYVASTWLALAGALIVVLRGLRLPASNADGSAGENESTGETTKSLLRESMPLLPVSLRNVVLTWCDIWLIAGFLGTGSVAIYHAASRIVRLIIVMISGVDSVASSAFARLHEKGETQELRRQSYRFTNLMIGLNLPILIACIVLPGTLLTIFGNEYAEGASVLRILAIGFVIPVLCGPVGYLLIMTNQHVSVLRVAILTMTLNLVLNAILIPRIGLDGAAVATAASVICSKLVSNLVAWRTLGFVVRPSWNLALPGKQAT